MEQADGSIKCLEYRQGTQATNIREVIDNMNIGLDSVGHVQCHTFVTKKDCQPNESNFSSGFTNQ